MSLELYAEKIAENITVDSDLPQISPVILSLVVEVLYFLAKKCLLDKKTVNSPGLFQQVMLRYYSRVACGDGYRKEARKIADALLKTGSSATQADLDNLMLSIYQEKIKRGEVNLNVEVNH
jgi:hypothetical protein